MRQLFFCGKYQNVQFTLYQTFSEREKDKILSTDLKRDRYSSFESEATSGERVFLLSAAEAVNEDYGFDKVANRGKYWSTRSYIYTAHTVDTREPVYDYFIGIISGWGTPSQYGAYALVSDGPIVPGWDRFRVYYNDITPRPECWHTPWICQLWSK